MNSIIHKEGYFFDLDGTLVDSSFCHCSAFKRVLNKYYPEIYKNFDYERLKGKSTPSVFRELGIEYPQIDLLTSEKRQLYLDDVCRGSVPVFAYAKELLSLLFDKNKKIYIVTSASKKTARIILKAAKVLQFINGIIASDDVTRDKPHPEIFLLALKESGMHPEEIVVVEDSLTGKTAAQSAGIDVILVNQESNIDGASNFRTLQDLYLYIKNIEGNNKA